MTTQSDTLGWVPEESFGGRLALIRQRYGWNVKKAAETCNIPVESWRRWERDHRLPRGYVDVCQTIASATGASYDWLLDGRRFPGARNRQTPEYPDSYPRKNLTLRNELVAASLDENKAA